MLGGGGGGGTFGFGLFLCLAKDSAKNPIFPVLLLKSTKQTSLIVFCHTGCPIGSVKSKIEITPILLEE